MEEATIRDWIESFDELVYSYNDAVKFEKDFTRLEVGESTLVELLGETSDSPSITFVWVYWEETDEVIGQYQDRGPQGDQKEGDVYPFDVWETRLYRFGRVEGTDIMVCFHFYEADEESGPYLFGVSLGEPPADGGPPFQEIVG